MRAQWHAPGNAGNDGRSCTRNQDARRNSFDRISSELCQYGPALADTEKKKVTRGSIPVCTRDIQANHSNIILY